VKSLFRLSITTKNFRFLNLIYLLCFLYLPLAHAAALADAPAVIVIQNATILTVSHGTIEHGSILIKDGKIAEVGQSVKAPKDAQVIDAAGQFVIPGIIDCHSHIAAESINEGSVSVSSMVNMAEILNPDDIDIYRDLAGGVTAANILHGSANSIGGQTLVIKLRWGQPAAKLPFEGALPGIKFALGENPKRSNFSIPGQPNRYPATRMASKRLFAARLVKRAITRKPGTSTTSAPLPARKISYPRGAICASSRSSKCWKANVTFTRIATARMKF